MNSIKKFLGKTVIINSKNGVYYGILNELEEHSNYFNAELLDCREIHIHEFGVDLIDMAKYGPDLRNPNDYDYYNISNPVNSLTIYNGYEIYKCEKKAICKIETFPTQEEWDEQHPRESLFPNRDFE